MSKDTEKKSRILYFSRIKALACIAVVVLHGCYMAGGAFARNNIERMTTLFTVRNLMYWAVPSFMMVSGALMLDAKRKIDFKKLFGKYLPRMVIALFAFAEIFAVYDHAVYQKDFKPTHLLEGVRHAVFDTFTENGMSWSHTWYLYLMIAFYLMLPIYRIITKSADKKELLYLLGLLFVANSVITAAKTLFGSDTLVFYIFANSIFPLYFFLGYAIHGEKLKIGRILSVIFILIGAAGMIFLTYYRLRTADAETAERVKNIADQYFAPHTVLAAMGVFALFKSFDNGKEIPLLDKAAAEIDKCSFGIYLIHMIVYKHIFAVMKFDPFAHGGAVMLILIMLIAFAVSYVITRVLKFVPLVKEII
ncbi:MAG: acyltransferase [Ruminococcus sp.]|uniref:acyltransferase n=1 Tax=Ruminococcus sp. TaxID=41978 RepID=UPI0025EC9DBB|nr:acyltransferase [Ruminococcus sp.]MBO4866418.1 acyltransferase [Ruminococcus sp.]